MTTAVIDTNVLLVANNAHKDVSPESVTYCALRLQSIREKGAVVIDDAWLIIGEYQNKSSPNQPKGVGDVFLKWLLQNAGNPKRVQKVTLTQTAPDIFEEFPVPALQAIFDPPDRKFAAVANAHPGKPPVWQATDCKWIDWWPALKAAGLTVEFLCPDDVCRFYRTKFPQKPSPVLPDQ